MTSTPTAKIIDDAKKRAARAAVVELPDGGIVGLGTGSTARHFVDAVGELVRAGRRFQCVCTSEATRAQATKLGIPLLPDDALWKIDVTVDGADEVDDELDLSKGAGGALTREKIVSFASRRTVIICDSSKKTRLIGETRAVSIEILDFGSTTTLEHLRVFGKPTLRPARTDANNLLVDLTIAPLATKDDKSRLDHALRSIPGVVETGLFLGRADLVYVADLESDRIDRLTK